MARVVETLMKRLFPLVALVALTTHCATPTAISPVAIAATEQNAPPIAWRRWDKETFEKARAEKRIVVVAIQTQWCHWCHVMDEETWSDPAIRALVDKHFVAIREDADARPDLGERYADWGWPALAVLTPDGKAITELRGFQEKRAFFAVLDGLAQKLARGEPLERAPLSLASAPASSEGGALAAIREHTAKQLQGYWDEIEGGWGKPQKYPFWAPIEASLAAGTVRGDDDAKQRALFTLRQARSLVDPVDGGIFQYSLEGKWTAPHYEKLAELNGALLGSYALAVTAASTPEERDAAIGTGRAVHKWMTSTMRDSSGAFYANQDADVGTRGERPALVGKQYYALDAAARAQAGAPFIDKHIYAAHNGRAIAGLARFAGATADDVMLADAVRAADVVIASHSTPRGFVHAAGDDTSGAGLLYLTDQIAMGNALVELYEATGDAKWRTLAVMSVRAMVSALWDEGRGAFLAHTVDDKTPALDVRSPLRANAEAARLVLKVGRLEGDSNLVSTAERALRSFATPAIVATEGRIVGEYLLAVEEALAEPLHFAIVGPGDTSALRKAVLAVHAPHRIVEQHEPGKKYPDLGKPTLYVCGATFCSPPITDAALVAKKTAPFLKPRT